MPRSSLFSPAAHTCSNARREPQSRYSRLRGIVDSWVGYTGGTTANPTYKSVCAGDGGHTEAMKLAFDPRATSYESVLTHFLDDPRVRPVYGAERPQYKTAIWAQDAKQAEVARRLSQESGKGVPVLPRSEWYDAEEYHQHFLREFKDFPEEDEDGDEDDDAAVEADGDDLQASFIDDVAFD